MRGAARNRIYTRLLRQIGKKATVPSDAGHRLVRSKRPLLAALIIVTSMQSQALADPVHDALSVCIEHGDSTQLRAEGLRNLGWKDVVDTEPAVQAWADASMIAKSPDSSDLAAWDSLRSAALETALGMKVDHVLFHEGAFVWICTDDSGYATCQFAAESSPSAARIFSESQALGTLEERAATYRARISRAVQGENGSGWITVLYANALGGRGETPDFGRKLAVSTTIAFITGPLEVTP
jgi:hypothetical protein